VSTAISEGDPVVAIGGAVPLSRRLMHIHQSKVLSISGNGSFLYSASELETAVRLKCNLVQLV
jgi:acetolactate synthase-1/2/3 large subunit